MNKEQIKMSDAFALPVKRVEGGVYPMLYDADDNLVFVSKAEYVDASMAALNSHDSLVGQICTLTNDIAILKKAMGSAFVAIEKDSDMDKASSLLTRALADTEDFK